MSSVFREKEVPKSVGPGARNLYFNPQKWLEPIHRGLGQPRSFHKTEVSGFIWNDGHVPLKMVRGRGQIIKWPVSLTKECEMCSECSGGESQRKTEIKGETWSGYALESPSWGSELEVIWSWNRAGPGDQLDVEDKGKRSPGSWVTPTFPVMPLSDSREFRREGLVGKGVQLEI